MGLHSDTPQLYRLKVLLWFGGLEANSAAWGLIILCSPQRLETAVNGKHFHISSKALQLVFIHCYYCYVPPSKYLSAVFSFVPPEENGLLVIAYKLGGCHCAAACATVDNCWLNWTLVPRHDRTEGNKACQSIKGGLFIKLRDVEQTNVIRLFKASGSVQSSCDLTSSETRVCCF